MKGTVKMFNKEKGFGFIRGEDNKDYFFHYSDIVMEGYKIAEVGEAVEFVEKNTDRGLRAGEIKKVA
ncbi:MAG: cold shock domain-containing protein [Bacilli bacterium]|nr:cold shock domain-containing protein [Bacilli bacterium]